MSADLSFWARRRAAVQAEAEAEARAIEGARVEARDAELAEKDDAEVLADMGLPDPAGMKEGDDFAAFMSRDVPENLRRKALRTLWRSNPVLACVDGLNEYDDDYRAAMLLSEPVKTAYQVGKGMLKHVEEMERQADAATRDRENDTVDEAEPSDEAELQVAASEVATAEPEVAPAASEDFETNEAVAQASRRMRFRFEEAKA